MQSFSSVGIVFDSVISAEASIRTSISENTMTYGTLAIDALNAYKAANKKRTDLMENLWNNVQQYKNYLVAYKRQLQDDIVLLKLYAYNLGIGWLKMFKARKVAADQKDGSEILKKKRDPNAAEVSAEVTAKQTKLLIAISAVEIVQAALFVYRKNLEIFRSNRQAIREALGHRKSFLIGTVRAIEQAIKLEYVFAGTRARFHRAATKWDHAKKQYPRGVPKPVPESEVIKCVEPWDQNRIKRAIRDIFQKKKLDDNPGPSQHSMNLATGFLQLGSTQTFGPPSRSASGRSQRRNPPTAVKYR